MSNRPLSVLRTVLLGACIAWKVIESLPTHAFESLVIVGVLGALPYLLLATLAALAPWMRPEVTIAATLVALAADVAARIDAAASVSSTAVVALLVAPIASAALVVPSAALLSWLIERRKGRGATRP